jgi:hypothetical protein
VTDSATLGGTANQPGSPIINGPLGALAGGSITFTLLGPNDCTTTAAGTGTNPQSLPVSGNGTYGSVSFTPSAVGTYHWVASYSGSLPNTTATTHNTACNDTSEDVIVQQLATTTTTTPQVNGSPVVASVTFGTSVTDHAVVAAVATGDGTPTGTVTFFVCNPNQTSGGACPSPNGTQVGSPVSATAVNPATIPPSSFADSSAIPANMTGTWCFRAVYAPDTLAYTGSSDASSGECFKVTDTTGIISGQTWMPNDSATVTSANGAPMNGTLTIQLYDGSSNCTTGAVTGQSYSKTVTNQSTATVPSANTSYSVSVTDTAISWGATFTSSDPNVGNSFHCESSSVTINN